MDIPAFIISVISLVFAIVIGIVQVVMSKRINNANLSAAIYTEVIGKYMKDRFPAAIQNICFKDNKLTNIEHLQEELNCLRHDIVFLKYMNSKKYNKLKEKSQILEDYIVENEDKFCSINEQGEVLNNIVCYLRNVYIYLHKIYRG